MYTERMTLCMSSGLRVHDNSSLVSCGTLFPLVAAVKHGCLPSYFPTDTKRGSILWFNLSVNTGIMILQFQFAYFYRLWEFDWPRPACWFTASAKETFAHLAGKMEDVSPSTTLDGPQRVKRLCNSTVTTFNLPSLPKLHGNSTLVTTKLCEQVSWQNTSNIYIHVHVN